MTANPLATASAAAPAFARTEEEVRAWCEDQNARQGPWSRSIWFHAHPRKDDLLAIDVTRLEGFEAEEVRKAAHGRLPDYVGWDDHRMGQHRGLVRYRLRMGMSQARFEAIMERIAAR